MIWNLAPVLQIVKKIPENYSPCLYLLAGQFWWFNKLWFKKYIQKMHPVSYTDTHQDVTDLRRGGGMGGASKLRENILLLSLTQKKYLQSDWLRGVQYWPYLYSVFNIYTLLLNKKISIQFL